MDLYRIKPLEWKGSETNGLWVYDWATRSEFTIRKSDTKIVLTQAGHGFYTKVTVESFRDGKQKAQQRRVKALQQFLEEVDCFEQSAKD